MHATVAVFYARGTLHPEAHIAVLSQRRSVHMAGYDRFSAEAPARLLVQLYERGGGLVVVPGDVVAPAGLVRELLHCPYDVCVCPVEGRRSGPEPHLPVLRFRSSFQQEHPSWMRVALVHSELPHALATGGGVELRLRAMLSDAHTGRHLHGTLRAVAARTAEAR